MVVPAESSTCTCKCWDQPWVLGLEVNDRSTYLRVCGLKYQLLLDQHETVSSLTVLGILTLVLYKRL